MSIRHTKWFGLVALLALLAGGGHAADTGRRAEGASTSQTNGRLGEMILIPASRFLMGNNGKEPVTMENELPQHAVNLPLSSSGTGPGDSDYIGFRVARSVPSQPEKGKP